MEKFEISVIRTGFAVKTISVLANSRLQAQDKALDDSGSHLYAEHHSEYELDEDDQAHQDEWSEMPLSQLILSTSSSNELAVIPAFVILSVTPAAVRTITRTMKLCEIHGLQKASIVCPAELTWGPSDASDPSQNPSSPRNASLKVTKDDFEIRASSRNGDHFVESAAVSMRELREHISGGQAELVICDDITDTHVQEQLQAWRNSQAEPASCDAPQAG